MTTITFTLPEGIRLTHVDCFRPDLWSAYVRVTTGDAWEGNCLGYGRAETLQLAIDKAVKQLYADIAAIIRVRVTVPAKVSPISINNIVLDL